ESLTQIAHRLRATLGSSGGALRTVRGVGFRLDAAIEPVFSETAPPAESRGTPLPAMVEERAPAVPRRSRHAIASSLLALVLLAALGGLLWWSWRSREILDSGFALRRSDLGSERAETVDLVREALTAWGDGD